MEHGSEAAAGFIAMAIFIYGIVILAFVAFTIWVYWRIFSRAGFNGAMSLLNLIPGVGPLICMLVLGFGRWPIEDELDALRATPLAAPTPPPPPAPPGSAMMPS